jgi:GNAT superfamily N-acetyltransferase
MVSYERLGANDGARLRAIRLRALQDAPDAFSTTYETARVHADDTWARQVVDLPTFIAVENGRDVAMVRCARDLDRPDTAALMSMWVAPEVRRRNIGGALVDLVVAWARSNGVSRLLLDVADLNLPAVALYASKGFEPTGGSGTYPTPRECIREHQRELRLVQGSHR